VPGISPLLLNIPSQSHKKTERNKKDSNREGRSQFVPTCRMKLYLKDPKDSTKKLLDLINTFNNVAEYKLNI
jgi:hypothetical protein